MTLAAIIDVDGTWRVDDLTEGLGEIDRIVAGGLPGRHRAEHVVLGNWGMACLNQDCHFLPLVVNVTATRIVHALAGSFFVEQLRGPVVLIGPLQGDEPRDVPLDTLLKVADMVGPGAPRLVGVK